VGGKPRTLGQESKVREHKDPFKEYVLGKTHEPEKKRRRSWRRRRRKKIECVAVSFR
jgi:hypothetical protein